MSLESAGFIPGLVATNPEGTDPKSQGDDHLRMLKQVLKNQFPAFLGVAVTKTEAQLNAALNAGDYGPGGICVLSDNWDALAGASGFYRNASGAAIGIPQPNRVYCMIHLAYSSAATSQAAQLAIDVFPGAPERQLYIRQRENNAWQPWNAIWDSQTLVKQSAPADTAAGRVLTVGAFGLGSSANITDAFGKDLNAYKTGGFYRVVANLINAPAVTEAILLVTNSTDMGSQLCWDYSTGAMYSRTWVGTTFQPWSRVSLISAELIASNGYRVTNGLVEQWGQSATIADDASAVVTFPLAMTECFSVVASPVGTVPNVSFLCPGITGITGSGFTLTNMSNQSGAACPFKWIAMGRV